MFSSPETEPGFNTIRPEVIPEALDVHGPERTGKPDNTQAQDEPESAPTEPTSPDELDFLPPDIDKSPLMDPTRRFMNYAGDARRKYVAYIESYFGEGKDNIAKGQGYLFSIVGEGIPGQERNSGDPSSLDPKPVSKNTSPKVTSSAEAGLIFLRHTPPDELTPEQAKELLVTGNLTLVLKLAFDQWRLRSGRVPLDDLIQSGITGLVAAVNGFKPLLGNTFATYATVAIKRQIGQGADDIEHTIYIPKDPLREIRRQAKLIKDQDGLGDPTAPTPTDDSSKASLQTHPFHGRVVASLDQPISPHTDSTTLGDTLPHTATPLVDHEREEVRELVGALLDQLDPTQRVVVELTYGFNDVSPMSVNAISAHLNMAQSAVKRILASAKTIMSAALPADSAATSRKDGRWRDPAPTSSPHPLGIESTDE